MKRFKEILLGIAAFFLIAAFAMLIIYLCVLAGMSIFGTEAFAEELPSIEEPCGLSTEELEGVLKGELKQYAQEFIWAEEDYEINFEYLDAYCTTPIEYIDGSLFESVKITDCVFDAENAYLASITYELIYNDGRTATFTKEFTESENPFVTVDPIINSIDGYDIRLSCYLGDYSEDGESFNTDKYYITVFAGSTSDTYEVENPHKDIMNGSLNIAQFFINLYIKIQEIFSRILSLIMFGF